MQRLIRSLARELPKGDIVRAYADDIALVAADLLVAAEAFAPIFSNFARASGLALNLRKTIFGPLGDEDPEAVRTALNRRCPGWGKASYTRHAEYLGSTLGPEAPAHSWDKALTKLRARAALWSQVQLGLYTSTLVRC
jgi:hypothetical protein